MTVANPFQASAAALGYVYQFRYSLVRALNELASGVYEWTIAIEAADDIEVRGNNYRELRQLKQVGRPLTDSSSDLWKTLRIWSVGVANGQLDPSTCLLYLVTTASAPTGSVANLLGIDDATRDETRAENLLLTVCEDSDNQINQQAYAAFVGLAQDSRLAMLRAIKVLPQSPDVDKLRPAIANSIRLGSRREYVDAIVERLEGWWFNKCILCLIGDKDIVTAEQLDSYIADLRDQFSPTNLPIDCDIVNHDNPGLEQFDDRIFVRQARLADIGNRRVEIAVRDYLRAYAQRSRWARLNLIQPDELDNYERVLREEWELRFQQLRDDLGDDAAEAERVRMAKEVYRWVEDAAVPNIRSQCTEPFVKRGSYHMLADNLEVGWHPDFLARLSAVLAAATG